MVSSLPLGGEWRQGLVFFKPGIACEVHYRTFGKEPTFDDAVIDRHLPDPDISMVPLKGAPSAHKMFRSVAEKVQQDRSQLFGAYFVLTAAESEHGTTIRAIRRMGIDPIELAAAARSEIKALLRRPR